MRGMSLNVTRADALIVLLAAALLAYLYAAYWSTATRGEQALVLVGGKEFAVLPLQGHRRVSVPGSLGDSVIEIRDGKVRFVDSPCRNKHCVHDGWLTLSDEFTACLPNRVSVQVLGREPRFDAINF